MDIEKYLKKVDKIVEISLKILIPTLGGLIFLIVIDKVVQIYK